MDCIDNRTDKNLVNLSKVKDTNSVTTTFLNTHCIVCGSAFQAARMSKLYCSPRCKQFGYTHKNDIALLTNSKQKGINPEPKSFLIDDFIQYSADQKNNKRYHELKRKQVQWETLNEEINNLLNTRLAVSNYALESLANKTLTDTEESLLDDLEEIEDEIKILDLKELSLEQWSFMKSLYPETEKLVFYQIISSLSKDFIGQLNIRPTANVSAENMIIKNKFVNHCNMIALGKVKFQNAANLI